MTSAECFENKWFYMKYIGKYLSAEILLTCECIWEKNNLRLNQWQPISSWLIILIEGWYSMW